MINAKIKKVEGYYKAVIEVIDSHNYVKKYNSLVLFTSRSDAIFYAKQWRDECLELGYVTAC